MDKEFPQGALNRIWCFCASLREGVDGRGEAALGVQGPARISGSTSFH